jgi:hypothetical protein
MIVRSHNEWGRLRSVVDTSLRAINYAGAHKQPAVHWPYPAQVIAEANEDLERD